MVRTQVQFTEEQIRKLKRLAAQQGVSLAELIRRSVDLLARTEGVTDEAAQRRRALDATGRFHSGHKDLAAEHDGYLEEAYTK